MSLRPAPQGCSFGVFSCGSLCSSHSFEGQIISELSNWDPRSQTPPLHLFPPHLRATPFFSDSPCNVFPPLRSSLSISSQLPLLEHSCITILYGHRTDTSEPKMAPG